MRYALLLVISGCTAQADCDALIQERAKYAADFLAKTQADGYVEARFIEARATFDQYEERLAQCQP